ncbi:hypothetical protein BDZ89DRAFT_1044818 [Hymenopellis radicata]|nr:hypothetical protein BDZ89DRAFT_1044818 [Hymenopellis radicata]
MDAGTWTEASDVQRVNPWDERLGRGANAPKGLQDTPSFLLPRRSSLVASVIIDPQRLVMSLAMFSTSARTDPATISSIFNRHMDIETAAAPGVMLTAARLLDPPSGLRQFDYHGLHGWTSAMLEDILITTFTLRPYLAFDVVPHICGCDIVNATTGYNSAARCTGLVQWQIMERLLFFPCAFGQSLGLKRAHRSSSYMPSSTFAPSANPASSVSALGGMRDGTAGRRYVGSRPALPSKGLHAMRCSELAQSIDDVNALLHTRCAV